MSVRSWFNERFRRGAPLPLAQQTNKPFLLQFGVNNMDLTPIKTMEDQLDAYSGWAYKCISQISQDLRANPRGLWEKSGSRKDDWTELEKIPQLFKKPNATDTWGQMIVKRNTYKESTGAAVWHLITLEGSEGGRIFGIEMVHPTWIDLENPIYNDTKTAILKYWVTVPGRPRIQVDARDLVLDFYFNPKNPGMPMSPIEGFALTHLTDIYSKAYAVKLIKDGGNITQAIVTDQDLTPEQADAYEARVQRKNRTPGRVSVFGKGVKIETPGLPLRDLDLMRIWKPTREQMCACWSIPPVKMGITEGLGDTNQKVSENVYASNCLKDKLFSFDEIINEVILPRTELANRVVVYESEDPVKEDKDSMFARELKKLHGGAKTVNQFKRAIGEDETPDGNVYFIPVDVRVVNSYADIANTDIDDPAVEDTSNPDTIDVIAEKAMNFMVKADSKTQEIKRLRRLHAESRFLREEESQERVLRSEVRRLFSKEQDDVVKAAKQNVRDITVKAAEFEVQTRDWLDEALRNSTDEWHEVIQQAWNRGMRTGARLLQEEVAGAISFRVFEDRARRFAQTHAGEAIADIRNTTMRGVRRIIAEGIEQGHSIDTISRRLAELYDGFRGTRSQTIARTEVSNSIGWGRYEDARETERRLGLRIVRQWVATEDERTREAHAAADGQEVRVDEMYIVGGVEMRHPGDTSAPAELIINCRCTETYRDVEGDE